ncbi:MAG: DNA topoisomerase IV subunit B, partial [Bacteroidota bacterium]
LFWKHMPQLINDGRLYIAQPPLYKLKKGKTEIYAFNDAERDEAIARIRKEKADRKAAKTAETAAPDEAAEPTVEEGATADGIVISRFKGLGELNPEQLWATTMNPETRTLLRVSIENAAEAMHVFETLMVEAVEPRREFIERTAQYVKNLDI